MPASVTFSANRSNAASSTTATFSDAGAYIFQVTVADKSGLTATTDVTVTVNQTITSITVSPATATVQANGTQTFTAQAQDQFNHPFSTAPAFSWSVIGGGGTIGASTGVYTAPSAAGTAKVQASAGGKSSTASITITPASTGGAGATVTYLDTDDRGTGFSGSITITDTGSKTISGWTLQFSFAPPSPRSGTRRSSATPALST